MAVKWRGQINSNLYRVPDLKTINNPICIIGLSIKFKIIKPSPENRVENLHDPGSGKDVFLKYVGKIRFIR